jgi:hypothetical protein
VSLGSKSETERFLLTAAKEQVKSVFPKDLQEGVARTARARPQPEGVGTIEL